MVLTQSQKRILCAFDEVLKRKEISRELVASDMGFEGVSSVNNWFSRGIPENRIFELMNVLEDFKFAMTVFQLASGVSMLSAKKIEDSPYARFFSQKKEESDRQKLDPEFTMLMGKRREDRTSDDAKKMQAYLKELEEEIEEENSFKVSIMEDWGL